MTNVEYFFFAINVVTIENYRLERVFLEVGYFGYSFQFDLSFGLRNKLIATVFKPIIYIHHN